VASSPVIRLVFCRSIVRERWLCASEFLQYGISLSSLPAAAARFSGLAGAFMILSVMMPKMNPSDSAMCSEHSATDQRSGAALKFHCAA